MASYLEIEPPAAAGPGLSLRLLNGSSGVLPSRAGTLTGNADGSTVLRIDPAHEVGSRIARWPERLSREAFLAAAYPIMYLSRRLEEKLHELYAKGYVKGTVALSVGNEATATGMAMPLRPGRDVVSIMHRDFPSHLLLGAVPYDLVCQYMANADSPTHGREGNVHHGDAARRRFPMISHLGKMPGLVVGGTWAARRQGEEVFGLSVTGDGGTSTGEFHEVLNIAAVHEVPVIFLIENNYYAFSTPIRDQYRCRQLSDRAAAFGMTGVTIDGTDPWEVYTAVCDALDAMAERPGPTIIESMCLRLKGHAAYDKGEYIGREESEEWWSRDPVPATRRKLQDVVGLSEKQTEEIEAAVDEMVGEVVARAIKVGRPDSRKHPMRPYAEPTVDRVEPFSAPRVKNGAAVNQALDYLLARERQAFVTGLDVGTYGSAFKTCKGLIDRYGRERVIDMPLCESGVIAFCLGASQIGARPIFEFQFADFSTETASQLGLNTGTWFFRSGRPAPLLIRLPCGGGLTMGPFHSGEFEGLWTRFPGLKAIYPATAGETFEALVAGFYDPNPCLVFEHKLLYWSKAEDVQFDGDLARVWRARRYTEGTDLTVVAYGAMAHEALAAAAKSPRSLEVINPFVLHPLEIDPIIESVEKTGRLLVVQESGETQGLGETIISRAVRGSNARWKCRPQLLAAPDVPVPFAPELESVYRPSSEKILATVERMVALRGAAG